MYLQFIFASNNYSSDFNAPSIQHLQISHVQKYVYATELGKILLKCA